MMQANASKPSSSGIKYDYTLQQFPIKSQEDKEIHPLFWNQLKIGRGG